MGGLNHRGSISFFKRITAPSSLTSQPPYRCQEKKMNVKNWARCMALFQDTTRECSPCGGRPPQTRNKSTRVVKNRRRRRQRDRPLALQCLLAWRSISHSGCGRHPPSLSRKTMPTAEGSGNNILCGLRHRCQCRSTYESDAAVSLEQKPFGLVYLRSTAKTTPPSSLRGLKIRMNMKWGMEWRTLGLLSPHSCKEMGYLNVAVLQESSSIPCLSDMLPADARTRQWSVARSRSAYSSLIKFW